MEFLNNMQDKCNVFDDLIANIISSKKKNHIVTELYIRGR